MKHFRYILDKSSKKYKCPNCGRRTLVLFIDVETGELLVDRYGRCDREVKCGYFFHPSKDRLTNNLISGVHNKLENQLLPSFHNKDLVISSMGYSNNLLQYFKYLFGESEAKKIQKKYKIGTLPSFHYGIIFWQIDEEDRVRSGKVIRYFDSGKRTEDFTWIHQDLKNKNEISEFNLSQCLFGLHLIRENNDSIIAVVESEKTACIMSVTFPEFLWMACGSRKEFKLKKLESIKHRKIIAYPDCEIQDGGTTTFQEWNKKAKEFNRNGFDITVSDLLEKVTTDAQKKEGLDIADFFMKEKK